MQRINQKVLTHAILMFIVALPVIHIIHPHLFWEHRLIVSYPVHSVVEAVGAIAAIFMGFLSVRWLSGPDTPRYLFISLGFISMGTLDLFHAMVLTGNGFVLLHSLAVLSGGALFSLVWLPVPAALLEHKKKIKFFTAILTAIIGVILIIDMPFLPEMMINGKFSPAAQGINLAAGLLFLVAAVRVYLDYMKDSATGLMLLLMVTAFSAAASFVFPFSEAWTDGWWFWHALRLAAFLLVLIFIVMNFGKTMQDYLTAVTQLEAKHQENLALFDGIDDVIYVSDPETYELLYVNETCKKLWGNDLLGEKCYRVLQNRDTPCPFCTNDKILGPYRGRIYVWEFQNAVTGAWFRCADKAIQWPDGRMVRFELASDISEQKQTQSALQEEKYFSDTLIDSLPGVFYMFDRNGRFLRWNKNLETVTEYSHEEITRMTPLDMFADRDRELIAERIGQVFTGDDTIVEAPYTTKSGKKIPHMFTGRQIEINGVTYLIGLGIDITDRKKAEDALQKLNTDLMRSNRELEQFAYVASHDLQEPLRMVASYVQLIEKRYKDKLDKDAADFIQYAVDGATRMKALINDLLTFSRVETRGNPFETFPADDAIKNAMDKLHNRIKETGARIDIGWLPEVHADRGQMVKLFENLLSNAIKFRGDKTPDIHIHSEKGEDGQWVFSVSDNGIGIDPQFFDRIFVIFQQLHGKGKYPGTGIGLAVCKRIVERHGGRIWVASEPGQGATLYFTLPGDEELRIEN